MAPHILIVDDDLSIRDTMHEFIQTSGYEASVASSAEEALDLLSVNTLEVVITDIMLPGMDGLELTDRIKRDHEIDVIVMTGYSTEYSYEEAISKGASDFRFQTGALRRTAAAPQAGTQRASPQPGAGSHAGEVEETLHHRWTYPIIQFAAFLQPAQRGDRTLQPLRAQIEPAAAGYRQFQGFQRYLRPSGRRQNPGSPWTNHQILSSQRWIPPTGTVAKSSPLSCRERMEKKPGPLPSGFVLPWRPKILPTERSPIWKLLSASALTQYRREEEIASFVQRADQAMYLSKQAGRNKVSFILDPDEEQG
jgi:CheY-like chemotaxis protein